MDNGWCEYFQVKCGEWGDGIRRFCEKCKKKVGKRFVDGGGGVSTY